VVAETNSCPSTPSSIVEQITGPGQFFDFWLLILYDFSLCADGGGTMQINFIRLHGMGPIKFSAAPVNRGKVFSTTFA